MKVDPKHAAAREIDGLVFALRADGVSLAEISRELGVSPARIRQREIRVWLRLLRAAKAAQPRLERRARAKNGESGRSTSAPAPRLSTGPIAETDAERPDSSKAGRSRGRPLDVLCFRCRHVWDVHGSLEEEDGPCRACGWCAAFVDVPAKCGRPDCPTPAAANYGGYCARHGFDHTKFCRVVRCGNEPAPGRKICLKHVEEELTCEVLELLRRSPF